MNKLILLTVIFTLSAGPAFAHCGTCGVGEAKGSMSGDMDAGKMAEHKAQMMTDTLGLSAEQAEQVKAAMQAKMDKKQAAKDEYKAKLQSILTPEQYEQYKAMKEEKGSGHHDMKGSSHHDMKGSDHHKHKGSHK